MDGSKGSYERVRRGMQRSERSVEHRFHLNTYAETSGLERLSKAFAARRPSNEASQEESLAVALAGVVRAGDPIV